ncbi:hypothetical protein [Streptomyces sp. NPDC058295]|uniref:hypothetical protein n=1 Tax=Streptomyces sp. NPDC058295 TaxID=3346431 RepID=UPI0036EAD3C1
MDDGVILSGAGADQHDTARDEAAEDAQRMAAQRGAASSMIRAVYGIPKRRVGWMETLAVLLSVAPSVVVFAQAGVLERRPGVALFDRHLRVGAVKSIFTEMRWPGGCG